MPKPAAFKKVETALRAHALAYPETHEDFPWGERAWKVKKKVFVFFRAKGETPPLALLKSWVDEGCRAVAPPTVLERLAGKK